MYPDELTWQYYSLIIAESMVNSLGSSLMFVSICALFTKIADESYGGTCMTLLTTLSNLGGTWPKFFALASIDILTISSKCIGTDGPCDDSCEGACTEGIHGVYPASFALMGFGVMYLFYLRMKTKQLTKAKVSDWKVETMAHA